MKTLIALLLVILSAPGLAQKDPEQARKELASLQWQKGPGSGKIAGKAEIAIADNHVFLDEKNTRRFLELTGNPPRDGHYTYAPASLAWFAIFSFSDTGYVKDDEKINPDDLLKNLKESDGPGNEERKRLGMSPIFTDGWQVPPHYDPETKRLEWGVRLKSAGGEFGLAALVLGGAAALATKKGFWAALVAFFAAFWKLIAGLAVAALAGLGSLFKRKKSS